MGVVEHTGQRPEEGVVIRLLANHQRDSPTVLIGDLWRCKTGEDERILRGFAGCPERGDPVVPARTEILFLQSQQQIPLVAVGGPPLGLPARPAGAQVVVVIIQSMGLVNSREGPNSRRAACRGGGDLLPGEQVEPIAFLFGQSHGQQPFRRYRADREIDRACEVPLASQRLLESGIDGRGGKHAGVQGQFGVEMLGLGIG